MEQRVLPCVEERGAQQLPVGEDLLVRRLAALLLTVHYLYYVGQRQTSKAIKHVLGHLEPKVWADGNPRVEEERHRVDERAVAVKEEAFDGIVG